MVEIVNIVTQTTPQNPNRGRDGRRYPDDAVSSDAASLAEANSTNVRIMQREVIVNHAGYQGFSSPTLSDIEGNTSEDELAHGAESNNEPLIIEDTGPPAQSDVEANISGGDSANANGTQSNNQPLINNHPIENIIAGIEASYVSHPSQRHNARQTQQANEIHHPNSPSFLDDSQLVSTHRNNRDTAWCNANATERPRRMKPIYESSSSSEDEEEGSSSDTSSDQTVRPRIVSTRLKIQQSSSSSTDLTVGRRQITRSSRIASSSSSDDDNQQMARMTESVNLNTGNSLVNQFGRLFNRRNPQPANASTPSSVGSPNSPGRAILQRLTPSFDVLTRSRVQNPHRNSITNSQNRNISQSLSHSFDLLLHSRQERSQSGENSNDPNIQRDGGNDNTAQVDGLPSYSNDQNNPRNGGNESPAQDDSLPRPLISTFNESGRNEAVLHPSPTIDLLIRGQSSILRTRSTHMEGMIPVTQQSITQPFSPNVDERNESGEDDDDVHIPSGGGNESPIQESGLARRLNSSFSVSNSIQDRRDEAVQPSTPTIDLLIRGQSCTLWNRSSHIADPRPDSQPFSPDFNLPSPIRRHRHRHRGNVEPNAGSQTQSRRSESNYSQSDEALGNGQTESAEQGYEPSETDDYSENSTGISNGGAGDYSENSTGISNGRADDYSENSAGISNEGAHGHSVSEEDDMQDNTSSNNNESGTPYDELEDGNQSLPEFMPGGYAVSHGFNEKREKFEMWKNGPSPEEVEPFLIESWAENMCDWDMIYVKGNTGILSCLKMGMTIQGTTRHYKGTPNFMAITPQPWIVGINKVHRDALIRRLGKKDHIPKIPNENEVMLLNKNNIITGWDLSKILTEIGVDEVEIRQFGMKGSLEGGMELFKVFRNLDPDCIINYDIALNVRPRMIHWGRGHNMCDSGPWT
eukprot:scaffold230010_cov56-Cyclotella_meneghiniana.AAC.2